MRANLKTGLCYCGHCLNGPPWLGRAREKREWMSEVQEALNENNKEGRIMIHRVNGTTPVPEVEPVRLYIDGSPIPLDEVWSLRDENGTVVGVWFE